MSAFGQGTGMNAQMLRSLDYIRMARDQWGQSWFLVRDPWRDGVLWSSSRRCGAASWGHGADEYGRWENDMMDTGTSSMLKFIGITRDSGGTALGGCAVKAYLTANDQFVREVDSDAGGYFLLNSEFAAVNHYLVAYLAGTPDVAGTTLNTLLPS